MPVVLEVYINLFERSQIGTVQAWRLDSAYLGLFKQVNFLVLFIGTRSPSKVKQGISSQNRQPMILATRHIFKVLYSTVQVPATRSQSVSSSSSLVCDKLYTVLAINLYQMYPDLLLWSRHETLTNITRSPHALRRPSRNDRACLKYIHTMRQRLQQCEIYLDESSMAIHTRIYSHGHLRQQLLLWHRPLFCCRHRRMQGGVGDARAPFGVQILSILCSFYENLLKSYVGKPWRVGAPTSGKSWIRNGQFLELSRMQRVNGSLLLH